MSEREDSEVWEDTLAFLVKTFPQSEVSDSSESLTIELPNEEWVLEIMSNGTLALQSGYDLEDMKSILSAGTAEDLGSDELAKQAKFYLQQTVSKYRNRLKQEGFEERVEMTDEYVAMMYERQINMSQLHELEKTVRRYQSFFAATP